MRDIDIYKVYIVVYLIKPIEEAKDLGYNIETCVEETIVKFNDNSKFRR